tara:strand:- start:11939 stop:13150 length:1212 start_codon:yes stop_codon:yes gene_type:complete
MKKLILLLFLSLSIFSADAASTKDLAYDGQNADSFALDLETELTRYREEQYPSTCTRQIPYTEQVCGYETRYRQQCRTEPGRNECRTVNDQVCRNVTRTRRQCSTGPDRRVCRTVPNHVCTTVNGQRQCRQQGTRQQCSNQPGQQTCRDVPYTDRVCTNQPRQVCTWNPPRQVCNSVPYQDYICRDVTRYRSEDYACTRTRQVPYTVERENKADVQVSYSDQNPDTSAADLAFVLDKAGDVSLKLEDRSSRPALVFINKRQNIDNSDDNLTTDTRFNISFVAREDYLALIESNVDVSSVDHQHLVLKTAKIVRKDDLTIKLSIDQKGLFSGYKFEKTLSPGQYTTAKTQGASFIDIDFNSIGAKLKDGKKYEFTVTLELKPGRDLVTPLRSEGKKTIQFKKKL